VFRGIVKTGIALGASLGALALTSAVARRPGAIAALETDLERLRERNLLFPVSGFETRALRDSYDDPRDSGSRSHGALDILAPRGTPVLAVDDGAVARLHDSVGRGGLSVYHFDPSSSYCYYYAHLDRYAEGLKDGAPLRKGDLVGYVGSTGNAPTRAPHLHFAIFKLGPDKRWGRGVPINAFLLWARAPKRARG
jgi:murein DD-endopeptidase MepM/ murein hydrolase activator NlpD